MKRASFSQRFCAYLIDIFFLAILTSLFTLFIPQPKSVERLYEEQNQVVENYLEEKIDMNSYVSQSLDLSYVLSKQTALSSIIGIFVAILYFCVYPFYCGGQTLGKKAMQIKIQKQDHSKMTMNDYVIRSSLINSILLNILVIALVLIASKDVYIWGSNILNGLQSIFVIISVVMVAFSKDKNGLHDKLVKTEVVKTDTKVKELEESKCEN